MKGYAAKGQSVDELVANQQAFAKEHGRDLTWDEAYDEVIADSMESILADGKVMELMRDIEAADKTLGGKIKNFFRDICDLLKRTIQAYSHVKPDSEEGRMVQGMQDIYDQLQQVFAEGVYEGGDNYRKAEKNTTAEGGVKYSPGYVNRSADGGYDFTKSFAEQLQDYLDGVFPQDETFIVGPTPNILLKIGLAKLPVTMDRKHVSYALEGTYPGSEERKLDHMMEKEDLANILAKISDPVAIIQDRQIWQKKPSGYSIDVLVDMEMNGKKTLIPINVNQSAYANKTEYDSNKITTVHGDEDTVRRLVNALNEHSEDNIAVFYINKEKASEFLQPTGHPISSTAAGLDGFIHRVTDKGSNVKMRISSVTESRQFIQWFGNWKKHPDEASKIVNTDGTPKVMYHGSPAQFTIFDKKKAKSSKTGDGSMSRAKMFVICLIIQHLPNIYVQKTQSRPLSS